MVELDETDRTILQLLLEDSRRSWRDIADRVDLSPPAVADRVERFEAAGIDLAGTVSDDVGIQSANLTLYGPDGNVTGRATIASPRSRNLDP
ncbi:MAG: Lrp/AsnC family transcriptional regulator, partial [Halobaculum sp.]